MIPSRIETAVSLKVASMRDLLAIFQESSRLSRGHFVQTLKSHAQTPKGTAVIPDDLSKTTTDRSESWASIPGVNLNTPMEFTMQIDVYESPLGKGYRLRLYAYDQDGTTELEKTINFGPLSRLQHDWAPRRSIDARA